MEPTTALGLSLGVTMAWFIVAWAGITLALFLALVAVPAARHRLRRPKDHGEDHMSIEALQRLQKAMWEEENKL